MTKFIKEDALLNDNRIYPLTKEIILVAGEYKRGDALALVDGKHGLVGETNYPVASFDAVLCDEMTIDKDTKTMAYLNGDFQGKYIRVKDGVEVEDLKPHGRKLQIFIK